MDWKKYNLFVGCAAVLVTVLVLFGGQLLWQTYGVSRPLDKVFLNIDGVVEADWEKGKNSGQPIKLYVTLQNIDNLAKTYADLHGGAVKTLGKKPFRIIIRDTRSAELERFYYETHYLVQEAIFTGGFTAMAEQLTAKAGEENIDLRVFVDAQNVYMQSAKAAAQMYVVIPRETVNREVTIK